MSENNIKDILREKNDEFVKRIKVIQAFLLVSSFMENITLSSSIGAIEEVLEGQNPKHLDSFDKIKSFMKLNDELKESGKSFQLILREKVITDTYQAFEYFLEDTLIILYTYFPKFLIKGAKNSKLTIMYDDIFCENHEEAKSNVIQRKVNEHLQSNVKDVLMVFKNTFDISLDLTDELINNVYLVSKARNVIIHNEGVVNKQFIEEMKKVGMERYQEDIGKLIIEDEQLGYDRSVLVFFAIAEKITNKLVEKTDQIKLYYNAVFKLK